MAVTETLAVDLRGQILAVAAAAVLLVQEALLAMAVTG
jgi:hypothetical protein